jgi:hypothetical protein
MGEQTTHPYNLIILLDKMPMQVENKNRNT